MPKSSQIKKKLRSPFTKTVKGSITPPSLTEVSPAVPVKLLSRCNEVTMNVFMQCICDDNLSALIVSGTPDAMELANAWATLFYEYCDLVDATEAKHRIKLVSEISLKKSRITCGQGWHNLLYYYYNENIAEALRRIGFDYDLNPEDPEAYHYDLACINAELRSQRFQLRIKEAEYEAILEKQSTSHSVDRKYFSTIFFRINHYAKYNAVNGQTTVEDYCAALRDYVAYIDSQPKNLKDARRI